MRSYIATPWEVKALLEGRKSQFTVPVKNAEDDYSVTWCPVVVNGYGGYVNEHGRPRPWPYPVGTEVAVKEAWWTGKRWDDMSPKQILEKCKNAGYEPPWLPVQYEDGERRNWAFYDNAGRARSAQHMPLEAARFTLEVTGVKVLRLGEMTDSEIEHEGFDSIEICSVPYCQPGECAKRCRGLRHALEYEWAHRYGKRFPYSSNPWVFSHTFEVVK